MNKNVLKPTDCKTSASAPYCLIKPRAVESARFTTNSIALPLGLAYIASAIEESGREVKVIDAVGEAPTRFTHYFKGYLIGLSDEEVVARIPATCSVVGISVIFTHEWPIVVHLIKVLKHQRPDVTVILGGEHITSMPEFCLMTSAADLLVLGEGEETIVQLLDSLDNGSSLHHVDGLAFREGGKVIVNKRRERNKEVDNIARPNWTHFNISTYHEHRYVGGIFSDELTVPILATRGCPYQCTYCSNPNMWTPRWIPRDPIKVVDEIEYYIKTFGAGSFPFQDLTAIIKKDWVIRFCNEVLERGLKFTWQLPTGTRSEAIDQEVADLLKRAGLIGMAYAPESGSELTRKLIKKKMKHDKLFDSIRAAAAAGLNVTTFLVIGFPHDKPEHLQENLPFIDDLLEAGVKEIGVGYYMNLPGTELFFSQYDAGRIKLDRAYFNHILDSSGLLPAQSYCDHIGRLGLLFWRIRMYTRFFLTPHKNSRSGQNPWKNIADAIGGVFNKHDDSKLPTAVRHATRGLWRTLKTKMATNWIPKREERALFNGWDDIYRDIRQQQHAQGSAIGGPGDTSLLYKDNAVVKMRSSHKTARSLDVRIHIETQNVSS